jgi:hypothetical protein
MCRGTFEEAYVNIYVWKHTLIKIIKIKPQNIVIDLLISCLRSLEMIVNTNKQTKLAKSQLVNGYLYNVKYRYISIKACRHCCFIYIGHDKQIQTNNLILEAVVLVIALLGGGTRSNSPNFNLK